MFWSGVMAIRASFRFSIYFIDRIVNNLKSSQILKFYLFGNYKECLFFIQFRSIFFLYEMIGPTGQ
jgi:hypothetical protein